MEIADLIGGRRFRLLPSPTPVPLAGGGMQCRLSAQGGKVAAAAVSLAPGFAPQLAPMLAIGFGDNPYALVRDLYAFALIKMKELSPQTVLGKPRWEKSFPEVCRHFGRRSWNAYYADINEAKLIASTIEFRDKKLPLRFVLIDDCWMQVERTAMVWKNGRFLSLAALEADPVKFPSGLKQTIDVLENDLAVTWVGVWMTFQGYWNGIKLDSKIGRAMPDALLPVTDEAGIPDPRGGGGGSAEVILPFRGHNTQLRFWARALAPLPPWLLPGKPGGGVTRRGRVSRR